MHIGNIWPSVAATMSRSITNSMLLSAARLAAASLSICIVAAGPVLADDLLKPLKGNPEFIRAVMAGWNLDLDATFSDLEVVQIQVAYDYWNSGAFSLDPDVLNDAFEARVRERLRFRLNELELTRIRVLSEGEYATKEQICHKLDVHLTLHVSRLKAADGAQQILVGAAEMYVSRMVGDGGSPCAGKLHENRMSGWFRFFAPNNDSSEELMTSMDQAIDAIIDELIVHFALSDRHAVDVVYGWSKGG